VPRSRLAVALVLPEPYRTEVDGLRRATGGDVERIAPHITLVPPVNVRDDDVAEALTLLRSAAATQDGALSLVVGPAATFAPTNRVLYLAVDVDEPAGGALLAMRDSLLRGVLHREDRRPFVPHVTLTNHLPEGDDAHALAVLGGYRQTVAFERVDLLRYDEAARRWSTLVDAALGSVRVVGRGGVEVELVTSTCLDPEAVALCERIGGVPPPVADVLADRSRSVVVVGRHEGSVVGVAVGQVDRTSGRVVGVYVAPASRRVGVGRHLLTAVSFELARRGASTLTAAPDLDEDVIALLAACGWMTDTVHRLVRDAI